MGASNDDLKIAAELRDRIGERFPLVDFRLFGSRARGDAEPDSDMDLFVECESVDRETESAVYDLAWEIGLKHGVVLTTLLFSRREVEESPLRASPILRAIHDEGVRP